MDKLTERIQTVRNTVEFQKTDRIPTHSNYWTYMILDQGYKLDEAIYNLDLLYDIVTGFHKKYQFDFYNYIGVRNAFEFTDDLDGNVYYFDDTKEKLNIKDYYVMQEDEYPLLIENPFKFYWEKCMPRKGKALTKDDAYESFAKAAKAYQKYQEFSNKVAVDFVDELSVPKLSPRHLTSIAFEVIPNNLRGLKGTSIDLRRRYSQVLDAVAALNHYTGGDKLAEELEAEPMADDAVFGLANVWLNHGIVNMKQFDDIYWPIVSKWYDACFKTGKKVMLFSEAEILRFSDHFQDFPKGMFMAQPEMDDVFELRKRCPNIAICGGMKPEYLGSRPTAEVLDYAKKLVDEIGPDGGFIMGQTKMMSYKSDATAENIAAVQEFCNTYRG